MEATARALLPQRKIDDALRAAYRALELRRNLLGDAHQDTWRTAELIADIHLQANQLDQAEIALQFDLSARERVLGPASVELARPLDKLAALAVKRRNYPAAEQLHRRVVFILETALGSWHPDVANGKIRLALLLLALCRDGEAEPLLKQALEIQERASGPTSPNLAPSVSTVNAVVALAELYRTAGSPEAGDKLLQRFNIIRVERARAGFVAPVRSVKISGRCVQPTSNATVEGAGQGAAAVVAGMGPGFRHCYNQGLRIDPNLVISVRITAHIDAAGWVGSASAFVPAGLSAQVIECSLDTIFQSRFAPPEGGGATITIPITMMTQ